jgi:hypothetical protein
LCEQAHTTNEPTYKISSLNVERKASGKVEMQSELSTETGTRNAERRLQKRRRVKIPLPQIETIDMRTRPGKLWKSVEGSVIADLGGRENLSAQELETVKSVCGLVVRLRMADAELLNGDPPSLAPSEYATLTNALNRTLASLGLQRRARDVTPSLDQYLAARAREKAEAAV